MRYTVQLIAIVVIAILILSQVQADDLTQRIADQPHWDIILFFIAQSIIIIGAIVAAYVRTQVAIAKLGIEVKNVYSMTQSLKNDHGGLADQVGHVALGLATLKGFVYATHPKGMTNIKEEVDAAVQDQEET